MSLAEAQHSVTTAAPAPSTRTPTPAAPIAATACSIYSWAIKIQLHSRSLTLAAAQGLLTQSPESCSLISVQAAAVLSCICARPWLPKEALPAPESYRPAKCAKLCRPCCCCLLNTVRAANPPLLLPAPPLPPYPPPRPPLPPYPPYEGVDSANSLFLSSGSSWGMTR